MKLVSRGRTIDIWLETERKNARDNIFGSFVLYKDQDKIRVSNCVNCKRRLIYRKTIAVRHIRFAKLMSEEVMCLKKP